MLLNASPINATVINGPVGPALHILDFDELPIFTDGYLSSDILYPSPNNYGWKQLDRVVTPRNLANPPSGWLYSNTATDGLSARFGAVWDGGGLIPFVVRGSVLSDFVKYVIDNSYLTAYRNQILNDLPIINDAYSLLKTMTWLGGQSKTTLENKASTQINYANPSQHLLTITYSDYFSNFPGINDFNTWVQGFAFVRFGNDFVTYVTDTSTVNIISGGKVLTDNIILWSQNIFYDLTYIESDPMPQPVDYWWPKVNNVFRTKENEFIPAITDQAYKLATLTRLESFIETDLGGFSKEWDITDEDDITYITDNKQQFSKYTHQMSDFLTIIDNVIIILFTYNIKVKLLNDFIVFNDGTIEYRILNRILEDDVRYITDQFIKFGTISTRLTDQIIITDSDQLWMLRGTVLGDAIQKMADLDNFSLFHVFTQIDFFVPSDSLVPVFNLTRDFDDQIQPYDDDQPIYIPAEVIAPEIRIHLAVDDAGIRIGVDNPNIILGAYS